MAWSTLLYNVEVALLRLWPCWRNYYDNNMMINITSVPPSPLP